MQVTVAFSQALQKLILNCDRRSYLVRFDSVEFLYDPNPTLTITSPSIPAFPKLPLGLPSHQIIDTITAGRECTGFPTGFFRIRASGSSLYWSLYNQDSSADGNCLFLSEIRCKKDTQVHSTYYYLVLLSSELNQGLLHKCKGRVVPIWRLC